MFAIIKQKTFWLYLCAVILVLTLFSVAQFGARNTIKVHNLPVAVLDVSNGKASQQIKNNLTYQPKNKNTKIKWIVVHSRKQLRQGYNDKKYYGAVIIKKNFSANITAQTKRLQALIGQQKIAALIKKTPAAAKTTKVKTQEKAFATALQQPAQQAGISFQINQGMNTSAATLLTTAFTKMGSQLNTKLGAKLTGAVQKSGITLSSANWKSLSNPVKTTTKTVNKIPNKSVSGMAPFLMTVFAWLGALISSLLLWREHKKTDQNKNLGKNRLSLASINSEVLTGLIASAVITGTIYVLAHGCYGVPVPDAGQFMLIVFFSTYIFYLLQTGVLDLFGFAGWPLLILVWILSTGVLSYAPEMLSSFFRNWVYSWTPIRFALDMITNTLYMPNATTTGTDLTVLGSVGIVALIVMYVSPFLGKREKR